MEPVWLEDITEPILHPGERIGFQLKDAPCTGGCDYCYERPTFLKAVEACAPQTVDLGSVRRMSNRRLAVLTEQDLQVRQAVEMSFAQIQQYFRLLVNMEIREAFFLGSEPAEHSAFNEILNEAERLGIALMVYTSGGKNLKKLDHPSIKHVVLHINLGEAFGFHGDQPTEEFMEDVKKLLTNGVRIDCRANFSNKRMRERSLIFNFYDKLEPEERKQMILKYSFSAKVSGVPEDHGQPPFNPSMLREAAPLFFEFVDEFQTRYPDTRMQSERPLFPCAFSAEDWAHIQPIAGGRSTCKMEFTVYRDGLALCPPSRDMLTHVHTPDPDRFRAEIERLRAGFKHQLFTRPSFPECVTCEHPSNHTCQGGCGSYKL